MTLLLTQLSLKRSLALALPFKLYMHLSGQALISNLPQLRQKKEARHFTYHQVAKQCQTISESVHFFAKCKGLIWGPFEEEQKNYLPFLLSHRYIFRHYDR